MLLTTAQFANLSTVHDTNHCLRNSSTYKFRSDRYLGESMESTEPLVILWINLQTLESHTNQATSTAPLTAQLGLGD